MNIFVYLFGIIIIIIIIWLYQMLCIHIRKSYSNKKAHKQNTNIQNIKFTLEIPSYLYLFPPYHPDFSSTLPFLRLIQQLPYI